MTTSTPTTKEIHDLLDDTYKSYTERNPKSLALYNKTLHFMPGANTRTVLHSQPFPLTFACGELCKLIDVDGHEYLDLLGEYSAGIYGHSNSKIKTAITEALNNGWNFGGKNQYEAQLAQTIVERFSYSMDMVRFCNSGTEANMMAIGAAINFTGKKKILAFVHGYHGGTISFHEASPKYNMNAAYDFIVADTYNDAEATSATISALPSSSLAAIIVEPMQVSGGCIIGDPNFLQFLRDLATKEKALLIFDEVMTSRLDYGGLQVKYGIKPDITTLGKWAGGGMSFGAFGGRQDVMEMFDPRTNRLTHSGTFNNNVMTMAAGIAGCGIMDRETVEKLNKTGDDLRGRITESIKKGLLLSEGTAPKMTTRGLGSLFGIYFNGSEKDELHALFFHHLLDQGIYIASRGFIALNIEIKEEHFSPLLKAIDGFIKKHGVLLV
ncbi:putative glutamate-1-semialdehyde 2,1-aminomutase [Tothia fuscella]|uniref:Glutamate-1-semialdehyde 2,1-aminomutase n=1 Tax=Tothia fuscella TaxID=1048955 RepID=A0A9P4P0U6_9PEZI|nr:putative glutamate-1-semialdehyde 2,1-aminomutase [Tothia fuscella]